MLEKRKFYIDGACVDPIQSTGCEVIDPSSEEPVAVIALGGQADTDAAVAAAKVAFGELKNSSM
jgi:aldehyde dehydrogenase (NAD+)